MKFAWGSLQLELCDSIFFIFLEDYFDTQAMELYKTWSFLL